MNRAKSRQGRGTLGDRRKAQRERDRLEAAKVAARSPARFRTAGPVAVEVVKQTPKRWHIHRCSVLGTTTFTVSRPCPLCWAKCRKAKKRDVQTYERFLTRIERGSAS